MIANPSAAAQHQPAIPALLTKALILTHFLPVGARTLDRMIADGRFPRPDIRLSGKQLFWRVETVRAWIAAQAQGGRNA